MKIFTCAHRIQTIGTTLVSVLIFGGIGYALGAIVAQGALGLSLGVLLSFPFNLWLLIRTIKKQSPK
jgi:hypothetical protein